MRSFMIRFAALLLTMLWLAPGGAQAQMCETFDADASGFGFCQNYGGGGSGQITSVVEGGRVFLRAKDGANGNHLCASPGSPLLGNWLAASDCTQVCFDVFRNHEGDSEINIGALTPRVWVYAGADWALFTWNRKVSVADGWNQFCAPVRRLDAAEALPTSADGVWTTSFGSDPARWNALFTGVTALRLPLDTNENVTEEVSYDNICLDGQNCPGTPTDEAQIDKTCTLGAAVGTATAPLYAAQCSIQVVPSPMPRPGDVLVIEEQLRAPDGTVNGAAIDTLIAAGWTCVPGTGPYATADVPRCFIAEDSLPPAGVTLTADLTLASDNDADWQNCARLYRVEAPAGQSIPTEALTQALTLALTQEHDGGLGDPMGESCVAIPVRHTDTPPPPAPVQCTVFEPELSCNTATGEAMVRLKHKDRGKFDPKQIAVSTQTAGITLIGNRRDPLAFLLRGAKPGDQITLMTDAVDRGAGSQAGLDLCCLGEVTVTIPEGFQCEKERRLDVAKVCSTDVNPELDTTADCTISVAYSGPPPTPADPIVLTEQMTGSGWSFTTTPLSDNGWRCPSVADGTPYRCTLDTATARPGTDWSNFVSQLSFQIKVEGDFENCVTATAADGLTDRACWSSRQPELTVEKTGPQSCPVGEPCTFTYTVTNTDAALDFSGPITLTDTPVFTPSLPGSRFSRIDPPLCPPADLTTGACSGDVSIPAGGIVTYQVDLIPGVLPLGAEQAEGQNCVALTTPRGPSGESCHVFTVDPPRLTLTKTGPEVCLPDAPCDFTITATAGATGYTGPVLLSDGTAGGNVSITAISPLPPGCGSGLPANPLACVVDVTLPANGSTSWTISATPTAAALGTENENCAALHSVPPGSTAQDVSFDQFGEGGAMSDALTDLLSAGSPLAEACVPFVVSEDGEGDYTVTKTCEADAVGLACQIRLTASAPLPTSDFTISDLPASGIPTGATITGPAGAVCDDATLTCTISPTVLAQQTPANTAVFDVVLPLGGQVPEGYLNCAIGQQPELGERKDCPIFGSGFDEVDDPPELTTSCSSNVVLVLDRSDSLGASVQQMIWGGENALHNLQGYGSQASIISFAGSASVDRPMAPLTGYTAVPLSTAGGTNWEAALRQALTEAQANPNTVIVFVTDGKPTAWQDANGADVVSTQNTPAIWLQATNEAIPAVNAIYAAGIPIIGVVAADASGMQQGTVTTAYLQALFGAPPALVDFGDLSTHMGSITDAFCKDVRLAKNIGPEQVLSFMDPQVTEKTVTVTLTATNQTDAALTGLVFEDVLPATMLSPTNVQPATSQVAITGQQVLWTLPSLAAGASESVSFDVTVNRPEENTTCQQNAKRNFAQLIAAQSPVQATLANMNPTTGPVVEKDEAEAFFCAYTKENTSTGGDCTPVIEVDKVRDTTLGELCIEGQPCTFNVTLKNSCAAKPLTAQVLLGDRVTEGGTATAPQISAVAATGTTECAQLSDWGAAGANAAGCMANLSLPAGGSVSYKLTLIAGPPGTHTNCFVANSTSSASDFDGAATGVSLTTTNPGIYGTGGDCTGFTVGSASRSSGGTPVLSVAKASVGECAVNRGSQSYECGFALTVQNTGSAAWEGPVVLSDRLTGTGTRSVRATGPDWTCAASDSGASCVNGALALPPTGQSRIDMAMVLDGLAQGGTARNCVALGVSDDRTEQVAVVQRAMQLMGIDGGPVDGKPGAKTRAGVIALQERLGLPADGEVTADLLARLGVPRADAATEACVTVNLPPMPVPPLVCDRATAVAKGGACQCRYERMVKRDRASCACTRGYDFVAGKGCVKRVVKDTPKPVACDAKTTVKRGDSCACRYKGMDRRNATSCACPKGSALVAGVGCVTRVKPKICPNGLPEIPGIGCVEIRRKKKCVERDAIDGCMRWE